MLAKMWWNARRIWKKREQVRHVAVGVTSVARGICRRRSTSWRNFR